MKNPRPAAESSSPATRTTKEPRRRDRPGHIDPAYAAELLARRGEDTHGVEHSFVSAARSRDALAEVLGEEFVRSATSGENDDIEHLDRPVPEDNGGPFIVSDGAQEFASGTDRSNPPDATREPTPKV